MAFETAGEKKLIDCFTGEASAAEYFVGLFQTDGTTELTGDTYARVSCGAAGSAFNAATGTSPTCEATNASDITFPTSGAAWNSGDPISVAGLFTALSGGSLLSYIALTPSVSVTAPGQTIKILAGTLTISVT